ncbi:MAG: hypothetical protein GF388_00635 [Candidatus Aegiribacteria sp.]|nr:hypothetical protein [Candidatus Aegiribacteria sp.]MBD3293937.1 hypothetical protein [Candidatus Fermentibacteria bacterium]
MSTPLKVTLALTLTIPFAVISCGSDPATVTVEPWLVVLSQWESAWNSMDLFELDGLMRSDFVHHLRESDWADYNGDGVIDSTWDEEYELVVAGNIFNSADSIYYSLNDFSGGVDSIWGGDSTGTSMVSHRKLVLEIYTSGDTTSQTSDVSIVTRQDSQGYWYIWQWFDGVIYP